MVMPRAIPRHRPVLRRMKFLLAEDPADHRHVESEMQAKHGLAGVAAITWLITGRSSVVSRKVDASQSRSCEPRLIRFCP